VFFGVALTAVTRRIRHTKVLDHLGVDFLWTMEAVLITIALFISEVPTSHRLLIYSDGRAWTPEICLFLFLFTCILAGVTAIFSKRRRFMLRRRGEATSVWPYEMDGSL
jgi:hypothetical protein